MWLTVFVKGVSREELDQNNKCGPAAEQNQNSTGVTERPKGGGRPRSVRTSEFRKTSNLWRSSSAVMKVLCTVHTHKSRMESKGRQIFRDCLFGSLQSTIFG